MKGDKNLKLNIPYGGENQEFCIQKSNLSAVLTPNQVIPPLDLGKSIPAGLRDPIGVQDLRTTAKHAKKVTIVMDDATRITPTHIILPYIIEEITSARASKQAIQILLANGTHREMTDAEIKQKVGGDLASEVEIINHHCREVESLVKLGNLEGRVEIAVNKALLESDLVIGVGSIVPHHTCGFSGGAKIILPGVSSEEAVGTLHSLSVKNRAHFLGSAKNIVRDLIDEYGRKAGLRFIVNTVLNPRGEVVGLVAGDPSLAQLEGSKIARKVWSIPSPRNVDIVVASSYPCDLDFWQSHKALYPSMMIVREGGIIILVTPCTEGISPNHPELYRFAELNREELERKIQTGGLQDPVAASLLLGWKRVREHATLFMVSDGLSEQECHLLGFQKYPSAQDAIEAATRIIGETARIAVLTHAPDTLPLV